MYRLVSSLLTVFICTIAVLGAAIPSYTSRSEPWSTPVSCLRDFAEYDFRRCSADLSDLIRLAHESLAGIELIGMRLIDVVGPGSVSNPDINRHCDLFAHSPGAISQYYRATFQ